MTSTTETGPATPARTMRDALLAVGYVLLAALGLGLLVYEGEQRAAAMIGVLLLLLAAAGLVLVGFDAWFVRNRPGVRLETAPSGAPATAFPRSPVPFVMSILTPAALALWSFVGAALAAEAAQWAAAALLAALGMVLASPLLPAARGLVRAGGLYLTPAGVEAHKEAVTWSAGWDDLSGAVPGEPLALTLRGSAVPPQRATTRWLWKREITAPPGTYGVDSRYLTADPWLMAELIARCIADPELRARMGTAEAVAEIAAQHQRRRRA